MYQSPSGNSQKTTKSAIPHLASHTLQLMPRRSPCASDPHTGHVSICFCGSPIPLPSSKKSDSNFNETSVSGPANQAPAGLHKFPASPAGAVPHVQTKHQPVETSGRFTRIHASNRSAQIPRANDGGPRVGGDTASASATTGRRTARRLRVGLKAGPGTAARLEVGNCGEGFACLFQMCVVLSHQVCADGSVFFAASCPRRVCRDSYSIFGLF